LESPRLSARVDSPRDAVDLLPLLKGYQVFEFHLLFPKKGEGEGEGVVVL